jgi:hypothetical protein
MGSNNNLNNSIFLLNINWSIVSFQLQLWIIFTATLQKKYDYTSHKAPILSQNIIFYNMNMHSSYAN